MRRILLILALFTLVACGDDSPSSSNGEEEDGGGNTQFSPAPIDNATLPSQNNTTSLPPVATSNTTSSEGENSQPTLPSGSNPTLPVSQPTFPPPSTNTATPNPSPTSMPEPSTTSTALLVPTEPDYCTTFRPDVGENRPSQNARSGESVTIYWFAPQSSGVTYSVELYNERARLLFSDETIETFYTFASEIFANEQGNSFLWTVTVLQNGQSINCTPLDGEIFIGG